MDCLKWLNNDIDFWTVQKSFLPLWRRVLKCINCGGRIPVGVKKTEYLVRWSGYGLGFDSWIQSSDIEPISKNERK